MLPPIIPPVDVELLKSELNDNTFLRTTNRGDNKLYVVNNETAPNVLREIGRLREVSFRAVGGGSGTECDLDHFDLEDQACFQLVVWNPEANEIIGGYRFTRWKLASFHENGQPYVNTEHLFDFSQKFIDNEFPHCIEMARAFVQPKYQSAAGGRKALFALDNLWDGIGGLIATDSTVKYLSGKVTISSTSPEMSRKAMSTTSICALATARVSSPQRILRPALLSRLPSSRRCLLVLTTRRTTLSSIIM